MAFRQKMWKHNSTDIHIYYNNIMLCSYIYYTFSAENWKITWPTQCVLNGRTANDIIYCVSTYSYNLSHFLFRPRSPSPTHPFWKDFHRRSRISFRTGFLYRHGRHTAHDIIMSTANRQPVRGGRRLRVFVF